MSLFYIWWLVSIKRIYLEHVSDLQRINSIIPGIRVIISALVIVMMLIELNYKSDNSILNGFVPTLLKLGNFLFRIIFWFIVILISKGFQIFRKKFTKIENRKLIVIYALVFVLFCADIIFEGLFQHKKLFLLNVEDLKNCLTLIFISIIVFFNCRQGWKNLNAIQNYAEEFMKDYVESLILKKKMIFFLAIIAISYTLIFIVVSLVFEFKKFHFQMLSVLVFVVLENLVSICLLFLIRARKFPQHFSVEQDLVYDEDSPSFNIYIISLPQLDDMKKSKEYNRPINQKNPKFLKELKNKNPEFVILMNPIYEPNENKYNIVSYSNLCYPSD